MKKIFALLLVLALGLALVACGGSAEEEQAADFHPETPEAFLETVLEDFNSRTEYRRRCEKYPDEEKVGEVLDVYISNIGTDELTLSGTLKNKETDEVNALYGEGNTVAKGPYLATSNTVEYAVMTELSQTPLHLETLTVELCVTKEALEQNLLSLDMTSYLEKATLTAEEDGTYTLTVPLSKEEIRAACKLETTTERGEYGRDSKIIYKADQTGALISVTCIQERGSYYPILKMEFSYETATHNKPAWFNKEDPLQSEGSKIAIVYEIDHGAQIYLTKDTEIKIDLNDFGSVHTIPSFIPTNVHYNRGSSPSSIIIEQWTPETTFSDWFSAKVFFKKGTRPNGDVRKNLYFEGEWEMKDGEPVVKK